MKVFLAVTVALTGTSSAAQVAAQEQALVAGAPLSNPNVAVHIVERKPFSDRGRHELALFPSVAQLNGKYTQHFGTALGYTYHLHENLALQVLPQWNWHNDESRFVDELVTKTRTEPLAATSLLLRWGAVAGVEVVPLYGKFAFNGRQLLHYSVTLSGAAGYGSTRHVLKPEGSARATYGDTGDRFLGSVGGGFRVQFGERFAIRAEVRDLVYTARVDRVNGCVLPDVTLMEDYLRRGLDPATAPTGPGCRKETFGTASGGDANVPLAHSLLQQASSDVLNLVSFYAGASVSF